MANKKRPKYIENILKLVNDDLRRRKVQDYYKDPLFCFAIFDLVPSSKGWYRGFNMHIDRYIDTKEGKKLVRALTGPTNELPEEDKPNWYVQVW